jgi:CHAT domain-containing protein/CHASE2 domain-containing protein
MKMKVGRTLRRIYRSVSPRLQRAWKMTCSVARSMKRAVYMPARAAIFLMVFLLVDLPQGPDHWSADLITKYFSKRLDKQHNRIALVEITNNTLDQYPYVSPIDRSLLAGLMRAIDATGPKAIGLDFIFDRKTEKPKDEGLLNASHGARAPIVFGALDEKTLDKPERTYQFEFLSAAQQPVLSGRNVPSDIFISGSMAAIRSPSMSRSFVLLPSSQAYQLSGTAEPGLILTPPQEGSEADDGYLSASEITNLRLDADWVILSACNTAAGRAENPEALSGVARAFFYAGARSLLVSHWAVYSDAAVALITKAVSELKADSKIGRAEALRRSMLFVMAKEHQAHPAVWAPFALVGEGGAL